MEKRISKTLMLLRGIRYRMVFGGIFVGAAAGVVVVLFRLALEKAVSWAGMATAYAATHPWAIALWFFLLLLAAAGVTALLKWEPMISGSGIPQVEGEMQGFFRLKWWRVLFAKFVGSILTIGAGLSLGREGPSIQLGAMVGKGCSRLAGRLRTEERILITCGAAAGLSAAFNAPLAGVLFSLEEVHKNFSVEVLLSSMAASITADFVSRNVFGLGTVFDFSTASPIPLSHFWIVLLLGILMGLLGAFYNRCIAKTQSWFEHISSRYIRTLLPFLMAGIFAFLFPVVLGGGSELVMEVSRGMPLLALLLIFVVKYVFSITSFSSGVPGGIFLPLLVLGALSGGVFHGAAGMAGLELDLEALVVLGMAGSFAAIVRAPVTGILLIMEMTGNFTHLLFLSLVALTAFIVSDLLHTEPVYEQLLRRMLLRFGKFRPEQASGEKVLIETPVHLGAPVCGRRIRQLNLPDRCLIISIERGDTEIVPDGNTILRAGDMLVALCDEHDSAGVSYALEKQCKKAVEPH